MEAKMGFLELIMIGVGGFFIFIIIFVKFAEFYDNRQAAKKKNPPLPKTR
jgi:hypothetical protein